MASTPPILLDRLKKASASSPDWATLQNIYVPLIKSWLTRIMGTRDEVDDLSQEVLVVLVRELPHFQSRGKGLWLKVPQVIVEDSCMCQIGEQRLRFKVGG